MTSLFSVWPPLLFTHYLKHTIMAKDKKSFLFYTDWIDTFESLPDDKAGQLIKHICRYVNDQEPQSKDLLINAVFANIKTTLKRDLEKWRAKSLINSENAKKRWHATASDGIKRNANDADKVKDKVKDKEVNNKAKAFIDWFNESMISVKGKKGNYRLTDKVKKQFSARLKGDYTFDEFENALKAIEQDEFHRDSNYKYLTPEFLTNPSKLEKYSNVEVRPKKGNSKGGVSMMEMYKR